MKGQSILSVVMWATGVSLTFAVATGSLVSSEFTRVNDKIDVHTVGISTLQTESKQYHEDIKTINTKLDSIMDKLNIIPHATLATSSPVL